MAGELCERFTGLSLLPEWGVAHLLITGLFFKNRISLGGLEFSIHSPHKELERLACGFCSLDVEQWLPERLVIMFGYLENEGQMNTLSQGFYFSRPST